MPTYRLTHLDDATLLRDLTTLIEHDRASTAVLLVHIAEVDARCLFLEAACSSMCTYCVRELRLSEDATYKRIQAARAARRFPRLFEDVASGRLHLTAVGVLAPHLSTENVDELVGAASGRSKAGIESWLGERFPAAVATAPRERVTVIVPKAAPAPTTSVGELALAQVDAGAKAIELAPAQVDSVPTAPTMALPHYVMQIPITEATHAKLRRAQCLLAHAVPSGQIAEVLDRALDVLLERLEKRKGAASVQERHALDTALPRGRAIPARIRRAVWERDRGRCTFAAGDGRRCDSSRRLEFDHVVAYTHGGGATLENLRLRCRAHNQLEAERTFGREFMRGKLEAARQGRSRP